MILEIRHDPGGASACVHMVDMILEIRHDPGGASACVQMLDMIPETRHDPGGTLYGPHARPPGSCLIFQNHV